MVVLAPVPVPRFRGNFALAIQTQIQNLDRTEIISHRRQILALRVIKLKAHLTGFRCNHLDAKSLLMQGSVMPGTQQQQIRKLRFASVSPVFYMVRIDEMAVSTARKPTPAITLDQRSPQSRRYSAGFPADIQRFALGVTAVDDQARIAGQPLYEFVSNAWPTPDVLDCAGLCWIAPS